MKIYFQFTPLPNGHSQCWWPVSESQGVSRVIPNLWGDLSNLQSASRFSLCTYVHSFFPPWKSLCERDIAHLGLDPAGSQAASRVGVWMSVYIAIYLSIYLHCSEQVRYYDFPRAVAESESCSDREHIKYWFCLGWSGRRKVHIHLNAKITLLLIELSCCEWNMHHGFTSSSKST